MSRTSFLSQGDLAAAYDSYADALFRHCYFRTLDRERGKELMLEVFQRTWKHIADGNYVDNMKMFLYRTANTLIAQAKAKDTLLASAHTQHTDEPIIAMLRTLPGLDRDAFVLRHVDELAEAEAADVLGESASTISLRAQRCVLAISDYATHV